MSRCPSSDRARGCTRVVGGVGGQRGPHSVNRWFYVGGTVVAQSFDWGAAFANTAAFVGSSTASRRRSTSSGNIRGEGAGVATPGSRHWVLPPPRGIQLSVTKIAWTFVGGSQRFRLAQRIDSGVTPQARRHSHRCPHESVRASGSGLLPVAGKVPGQLVVVDELGGQSLRASDSPFRVRFD